MTKKQTKSSDIKLSSTRINSFLQCKLKYKFQYIVHLPKLYNPSFKLGTACHEALEFAGNIWMKKEHFDEADRAAIVECYNKVAIREGLDDYEIHLNGLDMLRKRLDNFADGEKIIALEKIFGMKDGVDIVTDNGVPLVGAIDRVSEYDSETLLISDYKTQATAPTANNLKHDIQLALYDLAATKLFPGYKRIILSLDLLRFEPIYTYHTDAERKEFDNYLKTVYDAMLAFRPDVDAHPKLNFFCSWCDFRDHCDEFRSACMSSNFKFLELNTISDPALFEEWVHVSNVEKLMSSRKKELSNILIKRIRDSETPITKDNEELIIRQNSRVDFDTKAVIDTVPSECLPDLLSINKKALSKFLTDNPAFKNQIEESKVVNFNSPFIDKRKIKRTKK